MFVISKGHISETTCDTFIAASASRCALLGRFVAHDPQHVTEGWRVGPVVSPVLFHYPLVNIQKTMENHH